MSLGSLAESLTSFSSTLSFSLPNTNVLLGVSALQAVVTSTAFAGESTSPTAYSKFAVQSESYKIPSRYGMLIKYAPATLYSLYSVATTSVDSINRVHILAVLLSAHFIKRVLEVLFLHKFSGVTGASESVGIGLYYAFQCWIITSSQSVAIYTPSPQLLNMGIALFVIGQAGNFYHHCLLRNLRKQTPRNARENPNSDAKNSNQEAGQYTPPTGGLFDYVATPHYLFELMVWLGIALVSQQGNTFLVFLSMASYLTGRSVATHKWYKQKFGSQYPTRRNIMPGVF